MFPRKEEEKSGDGVAYGHGGEGQEESDATAEETGVLHEGWHAKEGGEGGDEDAWEAPHLLTKEDEDELKKLAQCEEDSACEEEAQEGAMGGEIEVEEERKNGDSDGIYGGEAEGAGSQEEEEEARQGSAEEGMFALSAEQREACDLRIDEEFGEEEDGE